jgi:hypothetical protein
METSFLPRGRRLVVVAGASMVLFAGLLFTSAALADDPPQVCYDLVAPVVHPPEVETLYECLSLDCLLMPHCCMACLAFPECYVVHHVVTDGWTQYQLCDISAEEAWIQFVNGIISWTTAGLPCGGAVEGLLSASMAGGGCCQIIAKR